MLCRSFIYKQSIGVCHVIESVSYFHNHSLQILARIQIVYVYIRYIYIYVRAPHNCIDGMSSVCIHVYMNTYWINQPAIPYSTSRTNSRILPNNHWKLVDSILDLQQMCQPSLTCPTYFPFPQQSNCVFHKSTTAHSLRYNITNLLIKLFSFLCRSFLFSNFCQTNK